MRKVLLFIILLLLFRIPAYSQSGLNVNFNYSSIGCRILQFNDSTTTTTDYMPIKWKWYFGDGDTASSRTVSHYYNNSVSGQNLQVKLVVTAENSYGHYIKDSLTKAIQIQTIPTVTIASYPNSPGCVSDTVQFYGASNQKISTWYWDFTDGGSSNVQNPLHHFADSGTYNVVLYVTDSSGCSSSAAYPFKVENPTLSFTANPNPGSVLDTLQFNGTSTSNVLAWDWTFGDGAIASGQDPTHQYSSNGTYNVTVSALTDNLCTPSYSGTVSIQTLPYCNFAFSGHCFGEPTTFRDESYSVSSSVKKWKFAFGDGTDSTILISDIHVQNPTVTHTYAVAGTYAVILIVTNSYGDSTSRTHYVSIVPKPTANFSYQNTCQDDSTAFYDETNDTTIDSWQWNLGDGYTDTTQNTIHKYAGPGTYPVQLIVMNSYGCGDTAVKNVVIDSIPTVSISMAKNKLCLGEQEHLYGNSPDTVSWNWDLGNGSTSSYQDPLPYSYDTSGTYWVTLKVTSNHNCSNTVSDSVVVMINPQVDFNYGSPTCRTDSVNFIDKSTVSSGILTSFNWDFGDTASAVDETTQENPTHYFAGGVGSYKVQLLATNSYGCSDSAYKYVKIYDTPKAGFTYIQQSSQMTQVSFTDTSLQSSNHSPISSYLWNFYQNDTSQRQNPEYNFPVYDSTYHVTLTVTDTNNCSNTDTADVYLQPPPAVNFTVSQDSSCLGEKISFSGQAPNIADWQWDFGDGHTSNFQNPVYQYSAAGTYTVTLSVTDINGYSNSVTRKVYVFGNPQVDFSYSTQTCQTDSVDFTDKTTTPSGGLSSFVWDFGDTASAVNETTQENPTHYFAGGAGSYKVQLVATNSYGCEDSVYKYVKIYDTPKAGFTYIQQSSSMTEVSFTDTSQESRDRSPVTGYLWSFYKGDVSDSANPTYNFPNYGQCYSVTLKVTDTNGCSNTDTADVCLQSPPAVDFSVSQDSICLGEQISFSGQASNVVKWHWDFGDGDTSDYQNPLSYTYSATGIYTVTLNITNTDGYSNSVTRKVYVYGNPKVDFSYGLRTCKTDSVSFLNQSSASSGILTSFNWAFGDVASMADQSTLQNPIHYFSGGAGSYKVQLVATNSYGCEDSAYEYVKIYDTPKAGFTYIQQSNPMTEVSFTDTSLQSSNHSPISSYLWNFYRNDTSHRQNPGYDFPAYDLTYHVTLTVTDTNNCSNTDTVGVYLQPPPSVNYTVSQDSICLGEKISFSGQASNVVRWHWDFGDGDTSDYQNPLPYTYPATGTYTVTLKITNVEGYSNSVTHNVFVSGNPQADFSYGKACQNDSVNFYDKTTTSSGGLSSFNWDFGDTASAADLSDRQNPVHYFSGGAGYYHVKLYVTNTYGCSDTIYKFVKVHDTPKAKFTYNQLSNPMTEVSFTDTSQEGRDRSPITGYLWGFYNGDVSDSANPSYDFPNYGQCYPVTLTVTDTNGCSNTDTVDVCLQSPPSVDFTVSQDSICLGEKISFSGQAADIANWHWDFGNGDTSDYQNLDYQYPSTGTYTVTLKVIDLNGFSNSVTHKVFVASTPQANFSYGRACQTDSVNFFDKTTTSSGGLSAFNWNFGDTASLNDQSATQNPVHYFKGGAGSYHVKLYVTNTFGCSDTLYKYVKIHDTPRASFRYIQQSSPMTQVSFTDTSQESRDRSPITGYLWNFYKGDVSDSANPSYNFLDDGQCYPVTLTVTDTNGCSNTDTADVCLQAPPSVDFKMSQDSICLGEKISFSGQASNVVSWHWDFGDGDTSEYQDPLPYSYFIPGTYIVTLRITNVDGYSNSVTHQVFVSGNPQAGFSYGRTCQTDSVAFLDETRNQSGIITSQNWDFGDTASPADQSTQQNPTHYFIGGAGTYLVRLYVTNNYGCSDTAYKYVKVHDSPKAGFTYIQQSNPMTEVSFTNNSQEGRDKSPVVGCQWSFYNGDISDSANPSYNFPNYGQSYPVTLRVTDTNGCSNTDTMAVNLQSPPAVNFTMSRDSICLGGKISFSGQATNVVSWHWDFGDGDTSDYQNPLPYSYSAPGTYTVRLKITNLNGYSDSVMHQVFVSGNPQADFSFGRACQTDSVHFYDQTTTSSGILNSFNWDFGDTASAADHSTQQNPAHYFSRGAGSYPVRLYVTNTYGCSDSVYKYVKVHDTPKAGFSYKQLSNPLTKVSFTDNSQQSHDGSPITGHLWSFYNGDVSDSVNPSYNFPNYGQCYPVTLKVTDTNGCYNTDTVDVCLLPPAALNFTSTKVCLGDRSYFKASYVPPSDTINYYFKWNFGDGSAQVYTYYDTITHKYNNPGNYQVEVTAVGTSGPDISVSHEATIDSLPNADFTFVTPGCDQATTFEAPTWSGGCPVKTWSWNFGDTASKAENTSNYWNPSHLYMSKDSTYYVSLKLINANGCADSATKPVVRNSCADVYYTVSNIQCSSNPVYFKDRSSLNSTLGKITQWVWNFGDGTTETYNAHQDSIYHVYKSAGRYKVTITENAIVNNLPASGSYDSVIMVHQSPQANFGYTPACVGQTVYFTDSTGGYNVGLDEWQWTFNDPSSTYKHSDMENPKHIYLSSGYFPVQLVVTDNENCSDTATKDVKVHTPPVASFKIDPDYDDVQGQVAFDNTSVGATSYFWEFGDGGTSSEENPVYTYSTSQKYNVLLIATNQYSCSDTATSAYDLTSGLFVPNSFVPGSGNAKINKFEPVGIHLKEYDIQVYSGWGNLLWESKKLDANGSPDAGWDGTYKGQPMPEGDYIWEIKAVFLNGSVWKGSNNGDGNKKPYGTVLLIR